MTNNIATLISGQIPEHLQGDAPLFVEFLETYYRYAAQKNKSVGLIQSYSENTDIDTTSDEYLEKFYSTYVEYFPKDIAYDKRNFIKLLNKIYDAKGTEKALKLIFRLLFNDVISLTYPAEQILRASGGIWTQENFITLKTQYGVTPSLPFTLKISNNFGDYKLLVSRIVKIDQVITRFYYRSFEKVSFFDDQIITIENNSGDLIYAGNMVKSASKLVVQNAGKGWQKGQVVVFNGSTSPSIARITQIDSLGGIKSIEVVEYGHNHEDGQTLVISPYPNRPAGSNIDINSVLVGMGVFHHYINITDQTDGCVEALSGIMSSSNANSYFLENYVQGNYVGTKVIGVLSQQQTQSGSVEDTSITIEQWLASRATISFVSDYVVKTKGSYYDDSGKLSNQEVKIQDNYFYQPFSYVVSTSRDIKEYSKILELTHPAGTKRFSIVEKAVNYSFNITSDRSISSDTLTFLDIATYSHITYLGVTKSFSESTSYSDVATINTSKAVEDNNMFVFDSINSNQFTKSASDDSLTSSDVFSVSVGKVLDDSSFYVDLTSLGFIKALDDSSTNSDEEILTLNKSIDDSVAPSHAAPGAPVNDGYCDLAYFSGSYIENRLSLTI